MMADTGASSIFLSHDDAQKMGVNMSALNYNIQYNTANGKIFAAEIIAKDLKVGEVSLTNVPITVAKVKIMICLCLEWSFSKDLVNMKSKTVF